MSTAQNPPDASIKTRMGGTGTKRTLTYDILRRPDQGVAFWEVDLAGGRVIGTVTGGGRGTLRSSPSPGSGTRTIEAGSSSPTSRPSA